MPHCSAKSYVAFCLREQCSKMEKSNVIRKLVFDYEHRYFTPPQDRAHSRHTRSRVPFRNGSSPPLGHSGCRKSRKGLRGRMPSAQHWQAVRRNRGPTRKRLSAGSPQTGAETFQAQCCTGTGRSFRLSRPIRRGRLLSAPEGFVMLLQKTALFHIPDRSCPAVGGKKQQPLVSGCAVKRC